MWLLQRRMAGVRSHAGGLELGQPGLDRAACHAEAACHLEHPPRGSDTDEEHELCFVICTFAPRLLDWDPAAVTLPYHNSNIQS